MAQSLAQRCCFVFILDVGAPRLLIITAFSLRCWLEADESTRCRNGMNLFELLWLRVDGIWQISCWRKTNEMLRKGHLGMVWFDDRPGILMSIGVADLPAANWQVPASLFHLPPHIACSMASSFTSSSFLEKLRWGSQPGLRQIYLKNICFSPDSDSYRGSYFQ